MGYLLFAALFWSVVIWENRRDLLLCSSKKRVLQAIFNTKYHLNTPLVCPCDGKKSITSCIIERKYQWLSQVSDFNLYVF